MVAWTSPSSRLSTCLSASCARSWRMRRTARTTSRPCGAAATCCASRATTRPASRPDGRIDELMKSPAARRGFGLSLPVVEDDAGGMALARAQPADAVAHGDPIDAARALHRPVVHWKDHALALPERHHLGARLHARPLLGQDEFAAGKIGARPRQQERDLQREHVLAVDVLVQAIVVARSEERRVGKEGSTG